MKNINEGSRGAARLARLKAAADKAVKTGNIAKERQINKTAGMAGGKTAVQTRMAIRGGADPKTAKATMPKPGAKKAFEKRSAAIANFAARGVARKALAMGMKKIKPKRPMVAAEGVELDEGVKRKTRLLRAKMKAKNYGNPETLKRLETSYNSELGRRVARKLSKGGAPKRTVVKFFNKDGTTPAADKAFKKFNSREMDTVRNLRARGVKPQYDHVEHDGDAVVEGSMGAARMARRLRSNNAPSDIVDRMSKITKKRIVRAGGAEDLKVRSKNQQANVRSLNALQRFHDMARMKKGGVEEGYQAKRIKESIQLDEAGYKKLMRMKAAAYKAGMQARGDSGTGEATKKYAKLMRRAADQETRQDAKNALRGQASQKAVERGGSIIGKRGVPTQQGMKLADERKRALTRFKSGGAVKRYMETGNFDGKLDKEGVAKKRQGQQAQAKFNKQARTGDFGPVDYKARSASMRAQLNYEKKYGRLKGK